MKTLVKVDENNLLDYEAWGKANPKNWNIVKYLNQFYDINAAIAFGKLYFPDFVEIQGCIILKFRYDEHLFSNWFNLFEGNVSKVERMCNLYEIKDYFHINQPDYISEADYNRAIELFSSILKVSLKLNLERLFPDKKFIVDLFDEYDTTRITLYSVQ